MTSISPLDVCRKHSFEASVTKSPNSHIARFEADIQNTPKRLAHFFALRHSDDFRYCKPLNKWLYFDSVSECWRACRKEHVDAAEALCDEAELILLGRNTVNGQAMARAVLRLAEFEIKLAQKVDAKDCEPGLAVLLGRGR